jgi:hypothetical protein
MMLLSEEYAGGLLAIPISYEARGMDGADVSAQFGR